MSSIIAISTSERALPPTASTERAKSEPDRLINGSSSMPAMLRNGVLIQALPSASNCVPLSTGTKWIVSLMAPWRSCVFWR